MKAWWCVIGIIPILDALKITTISYNCPDVCLCDSSITACQFTGLTDLPKNLNPNVSSDCVTFSFEIQRILGTFLLIAESGRSGNETNSISDCDIENAHLPTKYFNLYFWKIKCFYSVHEMIQILV